MRFSVVMPSYNAGKWIADALRSVAAQTLPAHEIIVIDGYSTDDTVEQIARSQVQVKFLQAPRQGISAARQKGVLAATGDWLAYLDADDLWYPEHLARAGDALMRSKDVAYMSHFDIMYPDSRKPFTPQCAPLTNRLTTGLAALQFLEWYAQRWYFSPSSIVQNRDVVLRVGGFDPQFLAAEDCELFLRVIHENTWTYNPAADWVYQVGTPDNLSSQRVRTERFALLKLVKNELLYPGAIVRNAISATARRAMAAAFMNGTKEDQTQAWQLAFPRLSIPGKAFYVGMRMCPPLFRSLVRLKRKLLPVK